MRRAWIAATPLLAAALGCSCAGMGARAAAVDQRGPAEAALQASGLLAYVGLDGNIHATDAGGRLDLSLTTDAAGPLGYRLPTWSADGRSLAFVHRLNTDEELYSLVSCRWDGSGRRELYRSADAVPFYLYWSPGGDLLSFLASSASGHLQLLAVASAGGPARALQTGEPLYWAWAPGGRSLVTSVGVEALAPRLELLDLAGGELRRKTLGYTPSHFQSPAYSPDGLELAVAVQDGRDSRRLLIVSEDGEVRDTLIEIAQSVAFDWSPRGNQLAFVEGERIAPGWIVGRLRLLDVHGSPTLISHRPEPLHVIGFFWSPDGSRIAYLEPSLVRDREGKPQLVLDLSILDARSGRTAFLYSFVPTSSFVEQILPFFDQYQRSIRIWSADGRYVVMNALTPEAEPGIFVVPVSEDGQPHLVAKGYHAFWTPR